jgi:hypothetical protein
MCSSTPMMIQHDDRNVKPRGRYIVHHQGMTPVRNAIDAHGQNFAVNDEMLLPILKAFAHSLVYYKLPKTFNAFSLCVAAELSVAPTNSNSLFPPMVNNPPAPRQTHPVPRGDHLQ